MIKLGTATVEVMDNTTLVVVFSRSRRKRVSSPKGEHITMSGESVISILSTDGTAIGWQEKSEGFSDAVLYAVQYVNNRLITNQSKGGL